MNVRKTNGLKIAIQRAGYTEERLAKELGLNVSLIKTWASGGGAISFDYLVHIKKLLKEPTELILFGEDRNPLSLKGLTKVQKLAVLSVYESFRKQDIYEHK